MTGNLNNIYAVIVAAGTGSRFGSDIPKQFVPLGPEGLPVLMHSVNAFLRAGVPLSNIRVVISSGMTDFWRELCHSFAFESPRIVKGGRTRYHSVKNALKTIRCQSQDPILIHDGARPLVTPRLIVDVARATSSGDNAVPCVALTDSIRKIKDNGDTVSVPRTDYLAVQTPQGFVAGTIKDAYSKPYCSLFTDDASVVEAAFVKINIVDGDPENIKITTPRDIFVAEAILKSRNEQSPAV